MSGFDDKELDPTELDPTELERATRALATADPQQEAADQDLREMTEAVGLIAYGLEPVEPAAQVRDRLLQRLGLNPAGGARRARDPLPVPQVTAEAAHRAAVPAARWLRLAVAAAILIALALAGVSGALYRRLQSQQQRLARLELELAEVAAQTPAQVRAELLRLREHFTLVTAPETSICRLNPSDPSQEQASGAVYMNALQRRWVLTASNLQPTSGLRYQVWFVTESGAVWAGSFEVGAQQSYIEIGKANLPSNPTAVMITLESPEVDSEPSGPTILYGDERAEML